MLCRMCLVVCLLWRSSSCVGCVWLCVCYGGVRVVFVFVLCSMYVYICYDMCVYVMLYYVCCLRNI